MGKHSHEKACEEERLRHDKGSLQPPFEVARVAGTGASSTLQKAEEDAETQAPHCNMRDEGGVAAE